MTRFHGEVVSVSELIERARLALDEHVGTLAVEGEVFEYRGPHASGHYYFKLRDGESSIEVKMWRGTAARGLRCRLEEGRAVLGIGRLDVWPKRGSLSFLLDEVRDLGAGDLARRFEELKQRLRAEGLFEPDRKRPVPAYPRRVALITAVPSAAEADVRQTFAEWAAPFAVEVLPTAVQGERAVPALVRSLQRAAASRPDVILLARGGGSLEDLWAFNEEEVVRAVAACSVPVVCAVGHETDVTLCDFVADLRCKTPTAGAAALARAWWDARERLLGHGAALEHAAHAIVEDAAVRLGATAAGLARGGRDLTRAAHATLQRMRPALRAQRPDRRLARARQSLNENELRLGFAASRLLEARHQRLARLARRLAGAQPGVRLRDHDRGLRGLAARLRAGSPAALLDRGYALVRPVGGRSYLRDAGDAAADTQIEVTLARGRLRARVEEVVRGDDEKPAKGGTDLRE